MTAAPSGWLEIVLLDLFRCGRLCLAEVERGRSEPDPEGVRALGFLVAAPELVEREEAYVVPIHVSRATRDLGWPTVGGRWDSVHRTHRGAPMLATRPRITHQLNEGSTMHTATHVATIGDILGGGELAVHEAALGKRATTAAKAAAATTTTRRVAVVDVRGPLLQRSAATIFGHVDGYDAIAARFAAALASDAVGVVLRIDSAGGVVSGLFSAVERMREAAMASGKPVVAYADEMAASAAYALACVATSIVVPASGLVGSVGVVAIHATQHRALDAAGVDVRVFRSGDRKAEGTSVEPLTESAATASQSRVDALAATFADLVARSRGMSATACLKHEGAIMAAADAVRLGFADRVGSLDDAIRIAAGLTLKVASPAAKAKVWSDYPIGERTAMHEAEPAKFFALLAAHRAEQDGRSVEHHRGELARVYGCAS